jgi:uncharacterized Zn finger protein
MSIRYERRTVRVAYQHIDALGYLRCHDCTPPEQRPELEFASPPHSEEHCSQCGRVVGTVTIETEATVAVEYVTCKIF